MKKGSPITVWSCFDKQFCIDLDCAVTKEKPFIDKRHGVTPIAFEVTEDELYYMGVFDGVKLYGIIEVS